MDQQSRTGFLHAENHLYAVLNLPKEASQAEINERHRSLSLIFHPDKQADPTLKEAATKEFLEVQKAYQVLSDPFLRQVYDTLGPEGLPMKWPPVLRSRTREEIQKILDESRLELTKRHLRQSIIPRGKYTCSLDATPLFSPRINGLRGHWITRMRDRIHDMTAISQSLVYAAEKKISAKTSVTLETHSNVGLRKDSIKFLGSIRHQFSPRLSTLTTFGFSHPHISRIEATYEDPDNTLDFKTIFSPFYLNSPPPVTLSFSRRLFRSKPQRGKISLHIAPQPSISLFLLSPPTLRLKDDDSSAPQLGPPTTLGLKYVAFQRNVGVMFDTIFPRVFAEAAITLLELSTRLEATVQFGFKGMFCSLGAHWSNERSEVSSTMVLNATSLLLQIDCKYLEQQLSLPIILATESSPTLVLGTFIVPSTLALLGYHFFVIPRRRALRKAHIQATKKAFEEDYDSRRQRNAVESLLKDVARKQMRQEADCDGLIIQEATYGPAETELEDLDEGLWLDVTIPVQALVRKSQLHISGGDSKTALQGFSDPAPFASKSLRIRYLFRGRQHYAEIPDYMPVVLPLAEHQVTSNERNGRTGPYAYTLNKIDNISSSNGEGTS